jgi:hypothetical protein
VGKDVIAGAEKAFHNPNKKIDNCSGMHVVPIQRHPCTWCPLQSCTSRAKLLQRVFSPVIRSSAPTHKIKPWEWPTLMKHRRQRHNPLSQMDYLEAYPLLSTALEAYSTWNTRPSGEKVVTDKSYCHPSIHQPPPLISSLPALIYITNRTTAFYNDPLELIDALEFIILRTAHRHHSTVMVSFQGL